MYTEYPHKKFWSADFQDDRFRDALKTLSGPVDRPMLLYVHIPYCEQLCWFCTCHIAITRDYYKAKNYLGFLFQEIELFRDFFHEHSITPDFREIHLGGGSPTFLKKNEVKDLVAKLGSIVDIENLREFSLEIDPRRIDKEMLKFYHEVGIDRISFGIQDFDPGVQEAINRVQPAHLAADLLTPDVRQYFRSVNFDVICGLPKQTPETMRKTMETVVEMSPDRVCFNYLHYSPGNTPHQKLLIRDGELPNSYERKLLFLTALETLEKGGYVRTGYDHFAKPSDAVVKSMEKGKMQWNSLGYTPGECPGMLGFGVHSYSNLDGRFYFQNVYEESEYEAALEEGRFPIYRGYQMSQDDQIRRDIINALRGYFYLEYREIEERYGIEFRDYFKEEESRLKELADDGIVEVSEHAILITELGKEFADRVCSSFDDFIEHD